MTTIFRNILLFTLLTIGFNTLAQPEFIIGSDLSYANMMEDCGAEFREDSELKDIFQIFSDNGTDLIRVRLWHNPDWQENLEQPSGVKSQYNNFEDAKETIFRAKMAGMKVMLGFHFSDFWCDPGRQIIPKAWEGVANNQEALADSVYNYVFSVLETLNSEDLMPEFVKIGNENNSGIMTHKGMNSNYEGITQISSSWSRHAKMFNAGIKAVRDISEKTSIKPLISLHVADPASTTWFYNNIISNGVTDFDIMGFTYYYSYHGQTPSQVGQTIKTLKSQHPEYEAMVVETGYLWDNANIDQLGNIITKSSPDYQPVSPGTQKKFMVDLSNAIYNNGGLGVVFWEPAWVSTPCSTPWGKGSSHEHVAFFDHRDNLNYMKDGGGGWPEAFKSGETTSEVNVTFNVDMTGQDVSRGVFIVGQITDWNFVEMQVSDNNIYSSSFNVLPGQTFAYYFLTSNNWDNYEEFRETVPEACANSDELLNDPEWNTDRAFVVPENDTIINNVWASCETFTTGRTQLIIDDYLKVFPNPTHNNKISIQHKYLNTASTIIKLYNTRGKDCTPAYSHKTNNEITINTNAMKKGIYVLHVNTEKKSYSKKIVIL
jgi:arabinogalactan endo-1,4-beta-galactosidase